MDFNLKTVEKLLTGLAKAQLWVFMSPTAEDHAVQVEVVRDVAREFEGRLLLVMINMDIEDNKGMLSSFGIEEENLPLIRGVHLSTGVYKTHAVWYQPDSSAIERTNVTAFIQNFLAWGLDACCKSARLSWQEEARQKALLPPKLKTSIMSWLKSKMSDVSGQDSSLSQFAEPPHETLKDWTSTFPNEVSLAMFNFLKPADLLKVAQTCKNWRVFSEDDLLWRKKCKEAGMPDRINPEIKRKIKHRNKKDKRFVYSAWKANYQESYRIGMNFCHKIPDVLTFEEVGQDEVEAMGMFNNKIVHNHGDDYYVSCASTGRRLAWLGGLESNNYDTYWMECDRDLNIQMDEQFIVVGLNKIIKVFHADTHEHLHTLQGHIEDVNCIEMHAGIVVSCSEEDTTLWMWDIQEGVQLRILTGHLSEIGLIQYNGKFVVSSDHNTVMYPEPNNDIKVWDPLTGVCLRTMDGETLIESLKFNGAHIVSGHSPLAKTDVRIKIWDVNTGARLRSLVGYDSYLGLGPSSSFVLVDRPDLRTATVWNTNGGGYLSRLDDGAYNHTNEIVDIQFNKKFVVTSSWDGTVKLWDIKTGKFVRNVYEMPSWCCGRITKMKMKDDKILCTVRVNDGLKFMLLDFSLKDANEDKDE